MIRWGMKGDGMNAITVIMVTSLLVTGTIVCMTPEQMTAKLDKFRSKYQSVPDNIVETTIKDKEKALSDARRKKDMLARQHGSYSKIVKDAQQKMLLLDREIWILNDILRKHKEEKIRKAAQAREDEEDE